jgi:hypothetical protein
VADLPQRNFKQPSRESIGSTGWFCEIADKKHGPMEFRELRLMALDRKLLGHHKVWRSGSTDQQEAEAIVGLIPVARRVVDETPPSDLSDENPYAPPTVRTIADGPPGGLYLPHLRHTNFLVFLLVLIGTGGLFYAGWKVPDPDSKPLIFSLASLGLLFWIILATVYLFRAWEMMRMFGAPLTGSKAVRFLFFPIFNALWSFVVVFGWAKLWNQNVKTHPGLAPASKVWAPFFFLFPILFLVSQALAAVYLFVQEWPLNLKDQGHLIALGVWSLSLGVGLICWFQISRSINFLARKKS